MPLSSTRLQTTFYEAFLALPATHPSTGAVITAGELMLPEQKEKLNAYAQAIAEAIINEIKDNAVSKIELLTHVHTAVTTGAGISGPPDITLGSHIESGIVE